jgi:hypothetical protein
MTLSLFLIPYALFLVFYFVFVFFNIYHLRHFAIGGAGTTAVISIYIVGTAAILFVSAVLLIEFDWSVPIDIEAIRQVLFPARIISPL